MAGSCVHGPFLAAHHKIVNVTSWERHSCDRYRFGFIIYQLHALLLVTNSVHLSISKLDGSVTYYWKKTSCGVMSGGHIFL